MEHNIRITGGPIISGKPALLGVLASEIRNQLGGSKFLCIEHGMNPAGNEELEIDVTCTKDELIMAYEEAIGHLCRYIGITRLPETRTIDEEDPLETSKNMFMAATKARARDMAAAIDWELLHLDLTITRAMKVARKKERLTDEGGMFFVRFESLQGSSALIHPKVMRAIKRHMRNKGLKVKKTELAHTSTGINVYL